MLIKGTYFDGMTAKAVPATIKIAPEGILVFDADRQILFQKHGDPSGLEIEPALGRSNRILRLDGSRQFETGAARKVEQLEKQLGQNQAFQVVGFLEKRWVAVAACFAGLILLVCFSIVYGLPLAAKYVAFRIPASSVSKMSRDAMSLFDRRFFEPSSLESSEKDQIRQAFFVLMKDAGQQQGFSLQFRKSKTIGANAFALPSGTIVITDELVRCARSLREIEGILIHEMAHVTNRHTLRSIIQNTGVVVLISTLAGDITSITTLAASIPTMLLESGYSRKFEIEADAAVAHYFLKKQWAIEPYKNILIRMMKEQAGAAGTDLFSTHPDIQERVQRLEAVFSVNRN